MAKDYTDLMNQLQGTLGTYQGSSAFGPSYIDQYRNANLGLRDVRNFNGDITEEQRAGLESGLKSAKGSAIAGGVIAGLNGATTLLNNAMQSAQINDITGLHNQIDDVSRIGSFNYNNFAQLANDYAQANMNVGIDYDDIRGMGGSGVTKEKVGAVGSSTLSGAATGFQIGGPWGALIGGVIGLGSGLGGVLAGDSKARIEEQTLKLQAQKAQDAAISNLDAAHERIADNQNRYNMVNSVGMGGKIERRKQSIMEYANKVAKNPVMRERRPSNLVSKKCNGGVMVRLKAK